MAAIWANLAALDWAQHLTTAWQFTQASSHAALAFLASLPGDCKLATLHTAMVCSGQAPEYITPGFGPFSLAWGWMIVGLVIGAALMYIILAHPPQPGWLRRQPTIATLAAMARERPAPPIAPQVAPRLLTPLQATSLPHRPPPGLLAPRDQERSDIVAYLARDGREALADLADASGVTEADFLLNMFGNGPHGQGVMVFR